MAVPRTGMKTLANFAPALRGNDTVMPDAEPAAKVAQLIVLAIRKRQDVFPEMITLGRTANNDMVLNDATISKFHAFFRQIEDRWEVVDVGSRNGTKVMGRPLVARQPAVVVPGTRIRFGTVDLTFHNAREAWDALRRV